MLVSAAIRVQAGVPQKMNYQGKLYEDGVPVEGTRNILFKIWDAASGGTVLWQSGTPAGSAVSVSITNGIFTYVLGGSNDAQDLSNVDWENNICFLEVIVEGTAFSPREEIVSTAYALSADDANKLGGLDNSKFMRTDTDTSTSGTVTAASFVGDGSALTSISGGNLIITYRLMGILIPKANVDGGVVIPFDGTVVSVGLYREVAGTSSSTIIDIHKNGTSLFTTQANRPALAFDHGEKKVTVTNMDVTNVSAGDILTCDIDQVEGGNPEDVIVTIELQKK